MKRNQRRDTKKGTGAALGLRALKRIRSRGARALKRGDLEGAIQAINDELGLLTGSKVDRFGSLSDGPDDWSMDDEDCGE